MDFARSSLAHRRLRVLGWAALAALIAVTESRGHAWLTVMGLLTVVGARRLEWAVLLGASAPVLPVLGALHGADVGLRVARADFLEEAMISSGLTILLLVGIRAGAARWVGRENAAPWHRAAWVSVALTAFWASRHMLDVWARLHGHPDFVGSPDLRVLALPLEPRQPFYPAWWMWLGLLLVPWALAAWAEFRRTQTRPTDLWVLLAPLFMAAAFVSLTFLEL